jgi:hypothetical protein
MIVPFRYFGFMLSILAIAWFCHFANKAIENAIAAAHQVEAMHG